MTARLLIGKHLQLGDKTFLQQALKSLTNNPDTILLIDTSNGQEFTAGEVHRKASAISKKLSELGVGHEDIVTIVSNCTAEAFIFSFGVWLTGAAFACINPFLPIEEIRQIFEVCQSKVGYAGEIVMENVEEAGEGLGRKITIIAPNGKGRILDLLEIIKQPVDLVIRVDQPLGKDHCLTVHFTSGTTGVPKGVLCRDNTFLFNSMALIRYVNGPKALVTSPLYWMTSAIFWTSALIHKKSIIIADRLKPDQLLKIIAEYKPSHWITGPSVLLDMCQLPELNSYDTSSLDNVLVGGALLFADHRKVICECLFKGRNIIRVCYGSTEAGGLVSIDRVLVDPGSPQYGSLGQTVDGAIVKIVDMNTGEMVPPYTSGEICVKSPAKMKSYINKDITESELDRDGFWHIGDLGYYDDEDYIYYQSRIKDIMKYRGQQIAPAELEVVIQKHPDVIESAVVGKPSPEYGELPAAFVVRKPNSSLTEQELYEFVSNAVIDEKKLRGGIFFLESLPKNAAGKVLRTVLMKTLTE